MPSRSISRASSSRAPGDFGQLGFHASHGGALGAVALFESCQLDAQRGVFLGKMRGVRFERFHLFALSGWSGVLARDAESFLLCHGVAIEVPLLDGALGFAPQAFQIEPSDGNPRVGASRFLGELAHFVIERQRIFSPPVAGCAAAPIRFRARRFHDRAFPSAPPALRAGFREPASVPANSRSSRLITRGPPAVFLPPESVRP